jgi:hypothetical protein
MSTIALKVNGRSHSLEVDPATPLLYVLSDDLALHGPKFGCGLGQCGACTVIANGRAIRLPKHRLSGVPPFRTRLSARLRSAAIRSRRSRKRITISSCGPRNGVRRSASTSVSRLGSFPHDYRLIWTSITSARPTER